MTVYVAGFMFDSNQDKVALIKKKRGPAKNISKWNALGGKLEADEDVWGAMVREFKEEAGVDTTPSDWDPFFSLKVGGDSVVFFRAHVHGHKLKTVKKMEDEEVIYIPVKYVLEWDSLTPNLYWLLPMALNRDFTYGEGEEKT